MWTPADRALVGNVAPGQALTDDQFGCWSPWSRPPCLAGGRGARTYAACWMVGHAISYDIDAFSIMFLGADREEDDGAAVVIALAECDHQGVSQRVMRGVTTTSDGGRKG